MNSKNKEPAEQNPEKPDDLKVTEPKKWAAGMPGVTAALSDVLKETGAIRGMKALLKMNQKDGFDCSSCAWPDEDGDRSLIAAYCENGAKALAEEATKKVLTAEFFAHNAVNDLAKLSDLEIGKKGRLTLPVYLPKNATHYQPLSWEDGFNIVAGRLNSLQSPDEAAFYTSGRLSNEASFIYQLFVRSFGTNNLPDCSNMCHESSSVALTETIGVGKGTVILDDFPDAEVIVLMGINPGTNMPRMLDSLQKAKQRGAKIISVNPLHEAGLIAFDNPQQPGGLFKSLFNIAATRLTDLYLQVKINGDIAVIKAIEKILLDAETKDPGKVFDQVFIKENTVGYDGLVAHIHRYDLGELSRLAGVSTDDLNKAAAMLRNKSRIIICWAMGITQHKNGVDTIKEIVNLALLKGSIGKRGAGVCPVRGHSNVQGNRTMMIWHKAPDWFFDKMRNRFGFEPSRKPGVDVVNCIKSMHAEKIKVFFAMGGNFLSATPDTAYTAEAIHKLKLTVNVSTKLNRTHLVHSEESIIFPTLSRSDKDIVSGVEQFVSCENSMGVVQMSKGMLTPVSDNLRSETQILCALAKATLGNKSTIDWDHYALSYDDIRNLIAEFIPGFENYNARVRKPGGFYLPNTARDGKFQTALYGDKLPFSITGLPENKLAPDEYMMSSVRSHDQFNTTIYGLEDRYRGIHHGRRVVFMNKDDIAKGGFKDRDIVDLFNYADGIERSAKSFTIVAYDIPPRCTITYYPEANALVPISSVAEKSNTPTSKMVFIKIKKHQG